MTVAKKKLVKSGAGKKEVKMKMKKKDKEVSVVDKLGCGFIASRFREITTWKFKRDLWERGHVAWGRRLASCARFLLGLNTK